MTGVPTEAQIEATLDEHTYRPNGYQGGCNGAGCEWAGARAYHRAHLAAVLVSTVLRPLTEERDAALARTEDGWRKTNAECIRHWNRADDAEARVRLLEDGITAAIDANEGDYTKMHNCYVPTDALRELLKGNGA